MSNPTMEHLVIDGTTYDIVDSTSGYTSNVGTVTGISMNGSTLSPSSGIVTLGTVITAIPEAHSLSYTYGGTGTDPSINNVGDMLDSHQDMIIDLANAMGDCITTETDPIFSASAAASITSSDITNWNSKTDNIGTVTGTGTSGYLTKWNGTNAITNGPTLSSTDDNKWLKHTGGWGLISQLRATDQSYYVGMQPDGNLVMRDSNGTAVWQTGAEGQRSPVLYVKTVTGTTNTNGNLSLALNPDTYDVLSVVRTDDNNTACVPFQGGSNWYARCYTANASTHSVRRNTASTLRVTYFNNSGLFS